MIVDPKGDPLLRERAQAAAQRAGRQFLEWTPTGPCAYNPYGHGSAGEIADKALAGERFTEPHYLRQAQRYLAHAVRALHAAGEVATPARLVELLDPRRLELLARSDSRRGARAQAVRVPGLTRRAPAQRPDRHARPARDPRGVRDRALAGAV